MPAPSTHQQQSERRSPTLGGSSRIGRKFGNIPALNEHEIADVRKRVAAGESIEGVALELNIGTEAVKRIIR